MGIKKDAQFRKIEVEGAGLEAAPTEGGGEVARALGKPIEMVLGGGAAGENFEDLLNFAGLGEIACFDAVGDEELSIFLEARFLGSFVDTVDGGTVFLVEVTGD